jgi:hypothetical protein
MLSLGYLGPTSKAQPSTADQIIGGILQQLSQQNNQPSGVPHAGVYARRYGGPPFGSSSVTIQNQMNGAVRLRFAYPGGGGNSVASVMPGQQYTKTGLPRGTALKMLGAAGEQDFVLSGNSMRITVDPSGQVFATSGAGGGGGGGPGPLPTIVGAIKITNRSNQVINISVRPAQPGLTGGYIVRLAPGDEWQKELPVGTPVSVSAGEQRDFRVDNGLTRVFVRGDGTIGTSGDWGGFVPPPPPGPGLANAGVIINNQSAAEVRASFRRPFSNRETVAIIVAGDTYARNDLAEGTRVTLGGSIPADTFILSGGQTQRLTVMPDGRIRTGNRPGPTPPPPSSAGDVEIVNRSGDVVVANFGVSSKTIRHNSAHTYVQLDAGRIVQISAGDYVATFTHRGASERVTVRPGGTFDGLPLFARVTRNALPPPLIDPDSNPNPPNNDDPPENVDPPLVAPANPLPLPNAMPLKESVVARFARKTIDETTELVDLLIEASAARSETIAQAVAAAGVDAGGVGLLRDAAKSGDPNRLEQLTQQFDDTARNELATELAALSSVTKIRQQLLSVKQKLAAGETSSGFRQHFTVLSTLATNLGDDGLAAAVARMRRDLLLRDTVAQGLETSAVGPEQMSLPQGQVTVISHPWFTTGNTYFSESGLLLVGSKNPQVLVTTMDAVDALQLPVAKMAESIPNADPAASNNQITVLNPAATRTKLSFKINDKDYTLAAGEQQVLRAGDSQTIEFSRGSSGEVARFDISQPGVYAFSAGAAGWDLARLRVDLSIANAPHSVSLVFVVDGAARRIDAGKTIELNSNEPIVVHFDTGEGAGTVAKRFADDAVVHFAIDPETGYWNLFAGPAPPAPKAGGDVVRIDRPTLADIQRTASAALFDFSGAAASGQNGGSLIDQLKD